MVRRQFSCFACVVLLVLAERSAPAQDLERVLYNHPGLVVDLGVGLWAWPLPMDYDRDGDMDLVVSCPDGPYNGTYFFENASDGPKQSMPVFKPGRKIGRGHRNIRVSNVDAKFGEPIRVLTPANEFLDFRRQGLSKPKKIYASSKVHPGKIRANQWHYVDWEGDGDLDLIVAVGDWTEYGWDDAYDESGRWTRGPLRGFVYLIRSRGDGSYDEPVRVEAAGKPLEVFGWPSPCIADFDSDGDLDIICGEFLDRLTWFENIGTRSKPRFAAGSFLSDRNGTIAMDLQMIVPVAVDWDRDGDIDLVVGQEDGRIAWMENFGEAARGVDRFSRPRFFQQEAHELKFGALSTPCGVDWDDDGDDDLICGNTAGYIAFIENLDGAARPKWAAPKLLSADGRTIRIQAGYNGSIQGPAEAKWGYTTLTVADWDHDGLRDVVVNSIWGEVLWYPNVGERGSPRLAAARPIRVEWRGAAPKPAWFWWNPRGKQLVTQWRTTPVVVDFNRDGVNDLVMLDHEGYLVLFERYRDVSQRPGGNLPLRLNPPKRIFVDTDAKPLRLNAGLAGKSGRRKLCIVDWNSDGRLDVLVNSSNATLYLGMRNLEAGARDSLYRLEDKGPLANRNISKHTTSPTVVDFNKNSIPDLLVGAEDGYFYYLPR